MNTILESFLQNVDGDGCDTGLLYEIVSFISDLNVAIHKGDDTFNRVNTIEKLVITTKGWDIQVQWSENRPTGSHLV